MRTLALQEAGCPVGWLLFVFILFLAIDACEEDSTSSGSNVYPTVAPSWNGSAHQNAPAYDYALTATFGQTAGALRGNWVWGEQNSGYRTRVFFVGSVDRNRHIALRETSYVGLNWDATGNWSLGSTYSATMNSRGDTIVGTWTEANGGWFSLVLEGARDYTA